jgi:hypothetical protein
MCWENLDETGIFQSHRASRIVSDAVTRIREMIIGASIALPQTDTPS